MTGMAAILRDVTADSRRCGRRDKREAVCRLLLSDDPAGRPVGDE
jgi:hypothetical protein